VWIDTLQVAVNSQSVERSKQLTDCVQKSPSKEADVSSNPQGIPLILQTQMFITVLTSAHHLSICSERPIHSLYPPHYFLNTNFNIAVPSRLYIPSCSVPSCITTKISRKLMFQLGGRSCVIFLFSFGLKHGANKECLSLLFVAALFVLFANNNNTCVT